MFTVRFSFGTVSQVYVSDPAACVVSFTSQSAYTSADAMPGVENTNAVVVMPEIDTDWELFDQLAEDNVAVMVCGMDLLRFATWVGDIKP